MSNKNIYCIENSWLAVGECRNVYVSFPERLSCIKFESLKEILVKQRTIHSENPETTHFDIVYDTLQEFYLKWGIEGRIEDTIQATLMY